MNNTCSDSASLPENLELFLSLSYGTVSLVLYGFLIQSIYKSKHLHHPFFYQFILLSVANMTLWTSIFAIHRLVPHPFFCSFFYPDFTQPSYLLKLLILGYYVSLAVQLLTVSTISINRMVVVLYPISTPRVWMRFNALTIEMILLGSFFYSFYLFDWGVKVNWSGKRLMVGYVDGWPHIPFVLMAAVLSVLCLFVIFVTATISLIKLCDVLYSTTSAEINLFWTNVGFSVTTSIIAAYSITIYIFFYMGANPDLAIAIVAVRGFFFDLNCLLPAWLLVATNRNIRNRFWPDKKQTTSFQVTAFSQQQRSRSK